jgi:hypothetical protein
MVTFEFFKFIRKMPEELLLSPDHPPVSKGYDNGYNHNLFPPEKFGQLTFFAFPSGCHSSILINHHHIENEL